MYLRRTAVICLLLTTSPAWPQSDEFSGPDLNDQLWCACQINVSKAPVEFLPDPDKAKDGFARITANIHSLGGNECRKDAPDYECGEPVTIFSEVPELAEPEEKPDSPEVLGPSFLDEGKVELFTDAKKRKNPHCTDTIMQQALAAGEEDECTQRQELRFHSHFGHPVEQAYIYTLRFRLPAVIEDETNSIRWVTAQWKQEPYSTAYKKEFRKFSASPVLAQRFDDGVLHITVQDEHCRCRVASALLPNGKEWPAKKGVAWDCMSTRPGDPDGKMCPAEIELEYGDRPTLPSPKGAWVEMQYRVQMGRAKPAKIEVYADGRFIVRVTGKIGYEPKPDEVSMTKFKIGHYRDYLPSVDQMDIDRVEVKPDD